MYDQARGTDDATLLSKAFEEEWILITNDKGFGDKVYREKHPHRGVIFLRLDDERACHKISVLKRLLESHRERLSDRFVVVTDIHVRFAD